MISEFNKLGDIADVIDSLHKTPKYSEIGRPMVRATDVKYGKLDLSKTFKVDDEVFAEFSRRYSPKKDDIVITRVGSYGITALVEDTNFCLGQNTSVIVPNTINARYLYLALNSSFVKNQIDFSVVGSTQKTLSLKAINNLDIPRFQEDIENEIAKILGGLDDKIELNRQTNQTLEQIAQAIFKSWFVDFEPTRAKIIAKEQGANLATQELAAQAIICGAITLEQLDEVEQNLETTLQQAIDEKLNQHNQTNPTALNAQQLKTTAALFPNELVELKEGGLAQQYNIIPEGWSVNSIFDIAEVIYGAPFKSKLFNTDGDGLPLVRIRDLKQERPGVSTPEVHPRGYLIQNGDLLVGMDGEFRPYIWGGHKAWMNQRVCTFKPKRNLSAALIREFISAQLRFFELTAVATTVIHLGKGDIDGFTYLEPNNELLNICSDVLEPIFQKIVSNKVECISLEELRDTLLPKLLSGELDVSAFADNSQADA